MQLAQKTNKNIMLRLKISLLLVATVFCLGISTCEAAVYIGVGGVPYNREVSWVPGHWFHGRWIPGHYITYVDEGPGPGYVWIDGGWGYGGYRGWGGHGGWRGGHGGWHHHH